MQRKAYICGSGKIGVPVLRFLKSTFCDAVIAFLNNPCPSCSMRKEYLRGNLCSCFRRQSCCSIV